jgi:hypothetical protein
VPTFSARVIPGRSGIEIVSGVSSFSRKRDAPAKDEGHARFGKDHRSLASSPGGHEDHLETGEEAMATPTHKITRFAIFLAAAMAALTLAAPLAQASDASTCTQGSPFAGWLSVIDEQGVPTLYRVAYAPANALCVQAVAQTGGGSKALTGQRPDSTMGSPSLGWVLVIDEQGVPTLFPSGWVSS